MKTLINKVYAAGTKGSLVNTREVWVLVRECAKLTNNFYFSEEDANRIGEILSVAEANDLLNFLISEVDCLSLNSQDIQLDFSHFEEELFFSDVWIADRAANIFECLAV